MKTIITTFLLAFCFIGCNENRIFNESKEAFPGFRWEKGQTVEFKVNIDDASVLHNHFFTLRHVYGFQLSAVNISVETTTPSGEVSAEKYAIKVLDDKGESIGDCSVDICDVEQLLASNVQFTEVGTYTFTVSHVMPMDILPNIMELGMIIDKVVK